MSSDSYPDRAALLSGGDGRSPIGLERMLRMYCVASRINLSGEACQEALYDIALFLGFRGFDLGGEPIADVTLIAVPLSTQSQEKTCGPEVHQVKKGNQWHFGMKVHIGVDSKSGPIHRASVTAANGCDKGISQLPESCNAPSTMILRFVRFITSLHFALTSLRCEGLLGVS